MSALAYPPEVYLCLSAFTFDLRGLWRHVISSCWPGRFAGILSNRIPLQGCTWGSNLPNHTASVHLSAWQTQVSQFHSWRLASPLSWAYPWRKASHPKADPINSRFTRPESSLVPFQLTVEDMGQKTGVPYSNALETICLTYIYGLSVL